MRADRLVQLLLMLQRRGKITVAEAADELEVSTRTARRDLEALAMSGVPVYPQRGRGGGWFLLGGATIDLSGLNESEATALVLSVGDQGGDQVLKGALRKIISALPEPFRDSADNVSKLVFTDQAGWGEVDFSRSTAVVFRDVSAALASGRRIEFGYVDGRGNRSQRSADPLGLVEKRDRWYLVAGTQSGLRSFRLDRFDGVFVLDDEVVRPPDFDLAEAWAQINVGFVEHALTVGASGRVASGGAVAALRARLGARVTLGATGKDGWIEFEARGWSHEVLGRELAGFGADLDVSAPVEVREVLARLGLELVELYG